MIGATTCWVVEEARVAPAGVRAFGHVAQHARAEQFALRRPRSRH